MKITLLTVGKTDAGWVKEGLEHYLARLRHYAPVTMQEIPELRNAAALTRVQVKEKEGERILSALRPSDTVLLLDEGGEAFRSVDFAREIGRHAASGKNLVFVIGGAYGFSEEVYRRCDGKVSLSPMTFPHQLVRVIFAEQLYRAFTIIKGEPYHHA